jgi:hypothetical protein
MWVLYVIISGLSAFSGFGGLLISEPFELLGIQRFVGTLMPLIATTWLTDSNRRFAPRLPLSPEFACIRVLRVTTVHQLFH